MVHRSKKFTQEQFIEAVKKNFSLRSTLKSLGLVPAGGNYKIAVNYIKELNLDISHWVRTGPAKPNFQAKDFSEILIENSVFNNNHLKHRLLKNNLLEYKCYNCGVDEWLGNHLSLHLDHINGINNDNRLENLRLLCPNCHSQTTTYAGKNMGKYITYQNSLKICKFKNKLIKKSENFCVDCGTKISLGCQRCKACATMQQKKKIEWMPYEELKKILETTSYVALAKKLGVSDNAIRKRLAVYERQQKRIQENLNRVAETVKKKQKNL